MELLNHTPYVAQVFRTVLDEDQILATIVVKATYAYAHDGNVTLERERPLPIYREYIPSDVGQIWPECFATRVKAEIFVLGCAVAPERRPVAQLDVRLRVGDLDVRARVSGRRTWQRSWRRKLQISAPERFGSMALDWTHAFGGRAEVAGRKVAFADNAVGRGYILDDKAAEGVELPNLEEPGRLIRRWSDHPRPLAFSPLPPGSALVDIDDPHNPTPPEASMSGPWATGSSTLNFAHPLLRTDALREGCVVVMDGMHADGPRGFVLETPQVFAFAQIGHGTTKLFCKPDTLYLYPQHDRYAITARRAFRYRLREGDKRVIRLEWVRE